MIADALRIPATFIEADVCALPESVPTEAYDVVFTSYGTIMWLPDLEPWADSIASRLASGGVFHIVDIHPFLTVFDDFAPERLEMPNGRRAKIVYAAVGVLVKRGLVVERLREHPVVAWQALDYLVQDAEGLWRLPPGAGDLPLMFALTVRKPVQQGNA